MQPFDLTCVGNLASDQMQRKCLVLFGECSHERLFVLGAMVAYLHKSHSVFSRILTERIESINSTTTSCKVDWIHTS